MTTTDPLTEAARAEAEQGYPDDEYEGSGKAERYAFTSGVEWARDHLAQQEPTDAEVEQVADRLKHRIVPDSLEGVVREVLSTALSVARASRRDEEKR